MDGYASVMAPLIVDRHKITYPAHYPYIIVTDTDLLNTAPLVMKQAGFGDVIGKYTALTDWRLAHSVKGDHYCEITAELVKNAVDDCVENMDAYFSGDPKAVLKMNDTLLLTGISIGLIGYTRPASGSEHHLAHFWEIDAIERGVEHPLHGNSVGLGSIASAEVYKIMRKRFEEVDAVQPPDPDMLRSIYARAGMALTPMELGISPELFKRSLNNGYRIRPRYTIFNFTMEHGMLPEIADEVTRIMCGGSK
jgi:glycerol-1-phosphate dehydrogenase [NAD(P)+]